MYRNILSRKMKLTTEKPMLNATFKKSVLPRMMLASRVLSQPDRNQGRRAHAHHGPHGGCQIHHWHGHRQTGNRHGPHAMPNEHAVNHVVDRLHRVCNNGRNRILHQQLPNAARAKQIGRIFVYMWCGIRHARCCIGYFQSKYAPALNGCG
jgi:hypothetical protein